MSFCWFFSIGCLFDCNQGWVGFLADFPFSLFSKKREVGSEKFYQRCLTYIFGIEFDQILELILKYSLLRCLRLGSILKDVLIFNFLVLHIFGLFDCNQGRVWIVGGLPLSSFPAKKTGTTSLLAWHHTSLLLGYQYVYSFENIQIKERKNLFSLRDYFANQ